MKFILLLAAIAFQDKPVVTHPESSQTQVVITRVESCDTMYYRKDSTEYRVRCYDVDGPEIGQLYGEEARKYTEAKVLNKPVVLLSVGVPTIAEEKYDILVDGKSLSMDLCENGFAWFEQFSGRNFELGMAQKKAEGARKGMWASSGNIQPWEFRKAREIAFKPVPVEKVFTPTPVVKQSLTTPKQDFERRRVVTGDGPTLVLPKEVKGSPGEWIIVVPDSKDGGKVKWKAGKGLNLVPLDKLFPGQEAVGIVVTGKTGTYEVWGVCAKGDQVTEFQTAKVVIGEPSPDDDGGGDEPITDPLAKQIEFALQQEPTGTAKDDLRKLGQLFEKLTPRFETTGFANVGEADKYMKDACSALMGGKLQSISKLVTAEMNRKLPSPDAGRVWDVTAKNAYVSTLKAFAAAIRLVVK